MTTAPDILVYTVKLMALNSHKNLSVGSQTLFVSIFHDKLEQKYSRIKI
jgi:hypothetical protein